MNRAPEAEGSPANPRRRFIRHTAGVPIEVRAVDGGARHTEQSVNVSEGGLSFLTDRDLALGSTIDVRIDDVEPPFEARAEVVWCSGEDGRHCVGVRFLNANDAFRARMVEQVCSIEQYRREVEEREGRVLTSPEAAAEWIGRYGERFPR
jgi:hypothetical protein